VADQGGVLCQRNKKKKSLLKEKSLYQKTLLVQELEGKKICWRFAVVREGNTNNGLVLLNLWPGILEPTGKKKEVEGVGVP